MRREQLKTLLGLMSPAINTIVGGDFNFDINGTSDEKLFLSEMKGLGFLDCGVGLGPTHFTSQTQQGDRACRIDFIFANSPPINPMNTKTIGLSNHSLLSIETPFDKHSSSTGEV